MFVSLFSHLFVFVLLAEEVFLQSYEGNPCVVQKTGQNGVCKLVGECPSAIAELQQQQFPQICGFKQTVPIVCCSLSIPITTTTTATPTVTTRPATSGTPLSLQKCWEYGLSVYKLELPPILRPGVKPINESQCSIEVIPQIVGGEKAKPMEFPHMTAVGFGPENNKQWLCGGTLISERFVLTAAHCLSSREFGVPNWIRVGDLNLVRTDDDALVQDLSIVDRIRHPDYRPPSMYHDIALLKTDRDVEFTAYVRPACLQLTGNIPDTATATGWGRIEFAGATSSDLLKVTLNMFTVDRCNASYSTTSKRRLQYGIIPETQVCAGSFNSNKDACQGDSGGPLQIFIDSEVHCMYRVIGVTSFGKACGTAEVPGVYTRVSNYVPWIESIVWQ